jgi:hypothetical protein
MQQDLLLAHVEALMPATEVPLKWSYVLCCFSNGVVQGLANLASGLAMMHVCGLPRPGHAWIEAFLEAAEQQLEDFTGQGLANTLWWVPPLKRLAMAWPAWLHSGSTAGHPSA